MGRFCIGHDICFRRVCEFALAGTGVCSQLLILVLFWGKRVPEVPMGAYMKIASRAEAMPTTQLQQAGVTHAADQRR